jgi:hypothetical protein
MLALEFGRVILMFDGDDAGRTCTEDCTRLLLDVTSVTFNGLPASGVSVTSGQSAWVNVPTGATTGPVTITTPNGSYTTTQNFTVPA